jgi:hypothetical protein
MPSIGGVTVRPPRRVYLIFDTAVSGRHLAIAHNAEERDEACKVLESKPGSGTIWWASYSLTATKTVKR